MARTLSSSFRLPPMPPLLLVVVALFCLCRVAPSVTAAAADTRRVELKPVPASNGDAAINFLVIGDWGRNLDGSSVTTIPRHDDPGSPQWNTDYYAQDNVGMQMANVARQMPLSLVVFTGDNFYWRGVSSVNDSMFQTSFEQVYNASSLENVPWAGVLGNHDYGGGDCMYGYGGPYGNVDAQIQYTNVSQRWIMPAKYYQVSAKQLDVTIDLFMLDTNYAQLDTCSQAYCQLYKPDGATIARCHSDFANTYAAQLSWLQDALQKSTADWRIVVGHHPLVFFGSKEHEQLQGLMEQHGVQAFFAGHAHVLSHAITNGVHHIISGAGGGMQAADFIDENEVWHRASYGFASCQVTKDALQMSMIDYLGETLYSYTIPVTSVRQAQQRQQLKDQLVVSIV